MELHLHHQGLHFNCIFKIGRHLFVKGDQPMFFFLVFFKLCIVEFLVFFSSIKNMRWTFEPLWSLIVKTATTKTSTKDTA